MDRIVKNKILFERIFSSDERQYILSKGKKANESAAGIFCAKEAVAKALSMGIGSRFWQEVEIFHESSGAPKVLLSNKILSKIPGHIVVEISISHTAAIANAAAIVFSNDASVSCSG